MKRLTGAQATAERAALRRAAEAAASDRELKLLIHPTGPVSSGLRAAVEGLRAKVGAGIRFGHLPDLSLAAGCQNLIADGVPPPTGRSPAVERFYEAAHRALETALTVDEGLHAAGDPFRLVTIPPDCGPVAVAVQAVWNERRFVVRINAAVQGVIALNPWENAEDAGIRLLWRVPECYEGEGASHITIVAGMLENPGVILYRRPAALVFWDMAHLLVRRGYRDDPDEAWKYIARSLPKGKKFDGVRKSWRLLRPRLEPGEVETHAWRAARDGFPGRAIAARVVRTLGREKPQDLGSAPDDPSLPDQSAQDGMDAVAEVDDLLRGLQREFGESVAEAWERCTILGHTQQDIAADQGVDQATISRWVMMCLAYLRARPRAAAPKRSRSRK